MQPWTLCEPFVPVSDAEPAPDAATSSGTRVTALILAEAPHLRAVARSLTRCAADADDLVQGTLMRAYAARDRFEEGTSVRAWTSTILRRLHLTAALSSSRRGVVTDTDTGGAIGRSPAGTLRFDGEPSTQLQGIAELLDDDVKSALERVPGVYRGAFLLAAVHGMSCAEIAARLCVHESTTMSRIHRARERLRAALVHRRRPSRPVPAGAAALSRSV